MRPENKTAHVPSRGRIGDADGPLGTNPAARGKANGDTTSSPTVSFALAVGLLSGAALAYEVLLLRLFAIAHWYHFAHLAIGVALLGFGASGTLLSLAPALAGDPRRRLALCSLGFALSAPLAFAIVERLPFNALEFPWRVTPALWLFVMQAALALPFLCAGLGIGIALTHYRRRAARVYAFDLAGAGAGAVGAIALLVAISPWRAAEMVAVCACVAGLLAARRWWRWEGALTILVAVVLIAAQPLSSRPVVVSEFKPLTQAMRIAGARLTHTRSSPRGWLATVENQRVPLRVAPGLSLSASAPPPPQVAVFSDGANAGAITHYDPAQPPAQFLFEMLSALPYHMREPDEVLVLEAGTGLEVLQALAHGAGAVSAVEEDRELIELVRESYAEFSGRLYGQPGNRVKSASQRDRVTMHSSSARTFLAGAGHKFDLIVLNARTAGGTLHSLDARYTLTVEGVSAAMERLEPGGLLVLHGGVEVPSRTSARLFATALAALERVGVEDPGANLLWMRSFDSSVLVLSRATLADASISAAREFATARYFDLVWYPGMRADEANRFNMLPQPYYHELAKALIGPERREYFERYKFDIAPATDDRPYPYDTLKWRHLPELLRLRVRGGAGLLELGQLVIATTVLQGALLGGLLLTIPLVAQRGQVLVGSRAPALIRAVYFGALGLGFMLVEIPLIQRVTLQLGHPALAAALTLGALLCFAGLGSAAAGRLAGETPRRRWLAVSCVSVGVIAVVLNALLPEMLARTMAWSPWSKSLATIATIAPLGVAMGAPFALGLLAVGSAGRSAVPWAWAVNGCASVVGAALATLSCLTLGIGATTMLGAVLYLCAALATSSPLLTRSGSSSPGRLANGPTASNSSHVVTG